MDGLSGVAYPFEQACLRFHDAEWQRGHDALPAPNVAAALPALTHHLGMPGQFIVITGETGVGKSSLLQHALQASGLTGVLQHHARLRCATMIRGEAGLAASLWEHKLGDDLRGEAADGASLVAQWASQCKAWVESRVPGCILIENAQHLDGAQCQALWSLAASVQSLAAPLVLVLSGLPVLTQHILQCTGDPLLGVRTACFHLMPMHVSQSQSWLQAQHDLGVLPELFTGAEVARMHKRSRGMPEVLLGMAMRGRQAIRVCEPAHVVEHAFRWLEARPKMMLLMIMLLVLGMGAAVWQVRWPQGVTEAKSHVKAWLTHVRAHTKVHVGKSHKVSHQGSLPGKQDAGLSRRV